MRAIALVCCCTACHHDCITTPCPLAVAAEITVTSATTHDPVENVTIRFKDGTLIAQGCNELCIVSSGTGPYDIIISAPGYESAERTFTVTGTTSHPSVSGPDGYEGRSCGCDVYDTQHVAVALTPSGIGSSLLP